MKIILITVGLTEFLIIFLFCALLISTDKNFPAKENRNKCLSSLIFLQE